MFTTAVNDLTKCVIDFTKDAKFKIAPKTTNNFQTFKAEVRELGYMLVSSEGCETSIYGNAYINILARVWHDTVHLAQDTDFSASQEIITAKIQARQVFIHLIECGYSVPRAKNASQLIYIDIAEQVHYYTKHKEFVKNQREFVQRHFVAWVEDFY